MNKRTSSLIIIIGMILAVVLAAGVLALTGQFGKGASSRGSRIGPPPGGPGMMGGPPGQFAEMQKMHKYAFQLVRLVENIGRLEENGKAPLTSAQAKSVLAVLKPLRESDSLEEASARDAVTAMRGILTDKQYSVISAFPPERQFRRNGPPPSGRGPMGPPPNGGSPPNGAPRSMEEFNPLNGPPGPIPDQQGPGGLDKVFDDLQKKSAGS